MNRLITFNSWFKRSWIMKITKKEVEVVKHRSIIACWFCLLRRDVFPFVNALQWSSRQYKLNMTGCSLKKEKKKLLCVARREKKCQKKIKWRVMSIHKSRKQYAEEEGQKLQKQKLLLCPGSLLLMLRAACIKQQLTWLLDTLLWRLLCSNI